MTKKRPCCVPGCTDKTSLRHRFPFGRDEVFLEWLKRILNPKLECLDMKKIYETYVVCHQHFIEDCTNAGSKRLKIYSLPTLYLPGFCEAPTKENSFLYPSEIRDSILKKESLAIPTNNSDSSVDGVEPMDLCTVMPETSVRNDEQSTRSNKHIPHSPGDSNGGLDKSAMGTADFLLFMDSLFDSVNGTFLHPTEGKKLRCAVSTDSPHIKFWRGAIAVLQSLRFTDGKTVSIPPSVTNWVRTLKGLLHIWQQLNNDLKFLVTRNFNQDPLENYFGSVRSHGVRKINPTCTNFKASFKTLLLNNFVSSQSVGSNCEHDDCTGPLDSLKELLIEPENVADRTQEPPMYVHAPSEAHPASTEFSNATKVYVSGYMARKVLKKVKGCSTCRKALVSDHGVPNSEIISVRSYSPKSLCMPNTVFTHTCNSISRVVTTELPNVCHEPYIRQKICEKLPDFDPLLSSCSVHNLSKFVTDIVLRFFIHQWCNNVNNILKGNFIPTAMTDPMKNAAYKKYLKHKSGKVQKNK